MSDGAVPDAVIGIDIGGTKTRAIALDDPGAVLIDISVGTASIQSLGEAGAGLALDELVEALGDVGPRARRVVAGSAGIDTPAAAQSLTRLLRQRFPGAEVEVVHDTRLLLAAGELDAGCVLIFGTGSAAWARSPHGESARSGGWGWLLGDEGSGYGLVREAIRHTLREADEARPPSLLAEKLMAAVGVSEPVDLIGQVYARPGAGVWAAYSPAVMEAVRAGCPAAREVLDLAISAGASEVLRACDRTGIKGPVLLCGGFVMHVPEAGQGVAEVLAGHGIIDVRVLERDPVWGAVDLARGIGAFDA
ncbi:MAG: N-acetylglucosamine kinase [Actinomycetales bacterium]